MNGWMKDIKVEQTIMLTSSIIKYLFIYFFTYLLTYLLTLTWCIDTAYISPEEAWVDADNGGKGM